MPLRARIQTAALAAALSLFAATAGNAHPHVWVILKSDLVFAPDGTVVAIRHAWTFDEMFSAFAAQGLDKNNDGMLSREELAELAEVNVTSLEEFNYFSIAKSGGKDIGFEKPKDYWLDADKDKDNVLTLNFTLPLKSKVQKGDLTLDVYDPTFFVDLSYAEESPVTLSGAPAGCMAEVKRPGSGDTSKLSESFFNSLTASSQYGSQFANRVTLHCK